MDSVFEGIYANNYWGNQESVSGPGSTLSETVFIRSQLMGIIKKYGIKSILDLPCGDFNWMSRVDFKQHDCQYFGGDIVEQLILGNKEKYPHVHFDIINILESVPKADLVFCRDCLVHFSYDDIGDAIQNIKKSKSKFLLTTNFPTINDNVDITTGGWRALNFNLPPFRWPSPKTILFEGIYHKTMMLWDIESLPENGYHNG